MEVFVGLDISKKDEDKLIKLSPLIYLTETHGMSFCIKFVFPREIFWLQSPAESV